MSQSDSHPDALPQDGLPQDASLLIVEDEPKIARLMADYLQSNHFAPSIISHGNEVIPGSLSIRLNWCCWMLCYRAKMA